MIRIILTLLAALIFVGVTPAQIKSVYTRLDEKHCRKLKPDRKNGEFERLRCKGVGGYWLKVFSGGDDSRAELVTPSAKEFDTSATFAGHHVASGTSEWRVKNGRPIGLIVRYSVQEPDGFKSYLVVSKISRTGSCVTDTVPPGKTQNSQARKFADASRKCNSSP